MSQVLNPGIDTDIGFRTDTGIRFQDFRSPWPATRYSNKQPAFAFIHLVMAALQRNQPDGTETRSTLFLKPTLAAQRARSTIVSQCNTLHTARSRETAAVS